MKLSASTRARHFFQSQWFFGVGLMIFVVEALWLIVFSRFPMVFDEAYHFELIQFFSHRLNPIVLHQPPSTYNAGAIAHNPSVLYYYVLSFLYRVIAHFTTNMATQVITVRVLNLLLALGTLIFLRKILLLIRVPRALAQAIVIIFAFTPLFTVLAAQINYDNGMLLATCACIYVALKLDQSMRGKVLPFGLLAATVVSCLLGSLVKYTFLPIGCAVLLMTTIRLRMQWRGEAGGWARALRQSFFDASRQLRVVCLALLIASAAMFAWFYGYNVVKFYNPVPQCNQVLTVRDCSNYAPWERNYLLAQAQAAHPKKLVLNVVSYTRVWLKSQVYQLYASVAPSPTSLVIPLGFYVVLTASTLLGAACCAAAARKVFACFPAFRLLLGVVVVYVVSLWARNYHDYLRFDQPVGVQGRYLLPVLMYVYAFVGVCAYQVYESLVLRHASLKWMRPAAAMIALAAFVYFGGYARYASMLMPSTAWQHMVSSVSPKSSQY